MNNIIKVIEQDIIFLSYDEPNAEKNYADLLSKVPWAKRVHGIKGSDSAHKACAAISETEYFITVDADNIIDPEFLHVEIDLDELELTYDHVFSWCGKVHVNGLMYGNGGLKMWTRKFVNQMKTHENSEQDDVQGKVEFCFNDFYYQFNDNYSESFTNTTPYQAWRAGFREGVKMCLDSGAKVNDINLITWRNYHRLLIWCNIGSDVDNGKWSILGAREGCFKTMLTDWDYSNVRDFDWLDNYWKSYSNLTEVELATYITNFGNILYDRLGLPIANIDNIGSNFFKTVYKNTPRIIKNTDNIKRKIKYDIFYISHSDDGYQEFKQIYPMAKMVSSISEAKKQSTTNMFWVVNPFLVVNPEFKFKYKINIWDEQYIHVFKNGEFFDGIILISKTNTISDYDFDSRFFTNVKEVDMIASTPIYDESSQDFDIVFIDYNEPIAEQNYNRLLSLFPDRTIHRISNVKGIHNAHIEAANLVSTEMFWVVDGDAHIVDTFDFNHKLIKYNKNMVCVWRSINPINGLIYGYGGVKLLPTNMTKTMNINSTDMTTSISPRFRTINIISNITAFNTDEFSTWKSAFRECVKLSSQVIANNNLNETNERLTVWCSIGEDRPYGKYAIDGANAGRIYGQQNAGNIPALSKINDFEWLNEQFTLFYKSD